MTDHPGEQFPPEVDPDVEPGADPRSDEEREPDYDSEPSGSSSSWVNPTQQARPHTDPLLAGFTLYGETPAPEPAYEEPVDDFVDAEDTEQSFEASLEETPVSSYETESYEETPSYGVAAATSEVAEPSVQDARLDSEHAELEAEHEHAELDDEPEVERSEPVRPVPSPAAFARPGPPARPTPPATPAPAPTPYATQASDVAASDDYDRDEDSAHPLVEETMARLDELRELPVGEHAEVYAALHERLQSALVEADAEHGDRG